MSKQPIEILLLKFELLSETLLHNITPNINKYWLG